MHHIPINIHKAANVIQLVLVPYSIKAPYHIHLDQLITCSHRDYGRTVAYQNVNRLYARGRMQICVNSCRFMTFPIHKIALPALSQRMKAEMRAKLSILGVV